MDLLGAYKSVFLSPIRNARCYHSSVYCSTTVYIIAILENSFSLKSQRTSKGVLKML